MKKLNLSKIKLPKVKLPKVKIPSIESFIPQNRDSSKPFIDDCRYSVSSREYGMSR